MCAREFSTSLYFSKWIFRDFIFQIIFSSSYLTKKETADASSVSGGCCTESLNSLYYSSYWKRYTNFFFRFFVDRCWVIIFWENKKKRTYLKIWKNSQNYYIRWRKFWAMGENGRIIFTIFLKYFYYRLFAKWVKGFLILYDKTYIKVFINF